MIQRSGKTWVLMVSFIFAHALGGCGNKNPTMEEMIEASRKEMAPILDKHRDATNAKIAAIKAAGEGARPVPPVVAREPATNGKTATFA